MSADLQSSGASWLIPIAAGVNYALNQPLSLTPIFLLTFTDVDTGRGAGATVMPGLTVAPSF